MKKPTRAPDPEWDGVYFSNYESKLLSAWDWARRADALFSAAALLEPEVTEIWRHNMAHLREGSSALRSSDVFEIHFMLFAYGVENVLKGALVRRDRSALKNEFQKKGELPPALRTHDLFVLAGQVGFVASREDEDLLRRLMRSAVWAGRYPVPVDFRDTSSAEVFADGEEWSVSHFTGNDLERLREFRIRLRSELGV
jgi:hypothetical protein